MADATHRLALVIQAKNEASKELQGIRGELGAVGQTAGNLSGILNAAMGVAGGLGAWKLGQQAIELSKVGAAAERTAAAFERRLGGDATAALEKMRAASQGTISDMDLMAAATRAQMLGVADDADTLSGLLEVAARRGRDLGMTTADAFSDIVTGIGRLSPMILDNLGIVMDSEATYRAYAQSVGKSADALTDLEKRQALVNRVLQEATGVHGELDTAGQWEAMAAAQANLRDETSKLINELILETGVIEKLTEAARGGASMLQNRRALAEAEQEYAANLELAVEAGVLSEQQARRLEKAARDLAVQYVYTGQSTEDLTAAYQEMNAELLEGHPEIEQYITNLTKLREWTAANAQGMYGLATATDVVTEAAGNATGAVNELARAMSFSERMEAGWEQYLRDWAVTQLPGWDPYLIRQLSMQELQQLYSDWAGGQARQRDQQRAGDAEAERAAREHARTMESLYREQQASLRSMAESILTPTAVTGADMFRAQTGALGGYVDKWDESARRLQDIANRGAASPWWQVLEIPEEVLGQGEEAVRIWAQETADAVQRGVRPDLIDWEAFDRAAEEFQRDQAAREQTVAMAMQRLGGTAPESDVRAMLGMPADATQEAMAVGEAFQQGLGAVDMARAVTERFHEQMQAQMQRWVTMGSMTVTWFARGLEEGVGDDTGLRIAKKLWPMIAPMIDNYLARGVWN